ncbi:MAG: beta-lactamase [Fluviicola sp.]|jgi:CubicO group peptidase (beta-lactamase class C family)|uniref:serine hydrolase domain-containing protein n=1 Tax=Fluviicola sp. TaxID=1917219 RepID=UPI002613707D|nr:serine hydrolase [Fluviicola sp.]MDF3027070.1 beta-lactamase [Fluviicola sp.]
MIKSLFFLLLLFFTNYTLFAQYPDIVKSDSITYPVHKNNIGKITFMGKTIPIEVFKESDFLTNFVLKEKTDLNIRVFMGNSLTNYLHVLSPQLPVDELVKNGNYQFTFRVDGKKIYEENLNPGAGSAESKNQKTIFRVPFISSSNEDSWGIFLWNRFLMSGGQDALTSGEHTLKIEIRPYVKLTEVLVGELIAEGQIKLVVPEVKVAEKLARIQSIKPLKDWVLSTDHIDTAKIELLNKKILTKDYKDITSIVVIKEGKLLLEEYFNGAKRNTLHDTRSVGKSFASTLLGIAIRDGYIKSETQPLNAFYDLKKYQNYSLSKDSIQLKDLLTMSSVLTGFDMDQQSPGNEEKMYPTANWVDFTLNLPVDESKLIEKRWEYFTAGVVVLGDVVHKSVPDGLENYAAKNLFQPLGITNYKWQFTPQKVVNTAGGLQMRSLDFAKYGQLYQNQGLWNGKQILPKDWVGKSLSHQIPIAKDEYYGYLFWNKIYEVEGKEYEVYYCSGNGGNKVIIFKDQPFVIVITATAYNQPYCHSQVDSMIRNYLIPAVVK